MRRVVFTLVMTIALVFTTAASVSGAPAPDANAAEELDSPDHADNKARVNWRQCGDPDLAGLECGSVPVPLDYDRPHGQETRIKMARLPAGDQANKLGTIFLNPGGPGGSGIDFVVGAGSFLLPMRCGHATT